MLKQWRRDKGLLPGTPLQLDCWRLQAWNSLQWQPQASNLAIQDNERFDMEVHSAQHAQYVQHAQQADHTVSLCFVSHSSGAGLNAVQIL